MNFERCDSVSSCGKQPMSQLQSSQSENQGGPTEHKADVAQKNHRWPPFGKRQHEIQARSEKDWTLRIHFGI